MDNTTNATVADAKPSIPGEDAYKRKLAPVFIPNLAGYPMKMHKNSGEEYCFTLTGLKAYSPNMGSRCGSDEWLFHCKFSDENYILRFADDASYGTYWDCTLVSRENAEQLEKLNATEWLILQYKAVKNNPEAQISGLHPDTIDDAKNIVQAACSRCGSISNDGFYGH